MNSIEQDEAIKELEKSCVAHVLSIEFLTERIEELEARVRRTEPPWAGLIDTTPVVP